MQVGPGMLDHIIFLLTWEGLPLTPELAQLWENMKPFVLSVLASVQPCSPFQPSVLVVIESLLFFLFEQIMPSN